MQLSAELINAVRAGLKATDQAAAELERVKNMYMMTPEGVKEHADRLFSDARKVADAAKARGLEAIETACETMDAEERHAAQERAKDTDYLARLKTKIELAKMLGSDRQGEDALKPQRSRMQTLFSEFANDPLSVALIEQSLGAERAIFFLPGNSVGLRQKHLREVVAPLFVKAMGFAGCDPSSFSADPGRRAAEVNAFVLYCNQQNKDFSRPDSAAWEESRAQRESGLSFDMAMMSIGW